MKLKTSDLTGPALDWAVAKCEGFTLWKIGYRYSPSTDWSQGGPIIERDGIRLWSELMPSGEIFWTAIHAVSVSKEYGPTPLIAAMRCFVASKLGDTVDVPEELL